MNSSSVLGVIGSVNMVEADEMPGRRSIGRAIEESLSMKIKRIRAAKSSGSEHGEATKSKGNSMAIEVEIPKGNHGGCVGEASGGVDSVSDKRVQYLQPSTKQETPKVAEKKLNLEKLDTKSEAYILDKLSLLQPSFRTLFEPSVIGATSTGSSDNNNKTGHQEAPKSNWKKKIKHVFAKATNLGSKKQLQHPDMQNILYETDVKGLLKMRWIEERKKIEVKQKRRWLSSCICCPRCNSSGRQRKEWEFQLEQYSSAAW